MPRAVDRSEVPHYRPMTLVGLAAYLAGTDDADHRPPRDLRRPR